MANVATNKSARLYFSDGGGTPNTLLVSPMEGDVEYSPGETSILEVLDRGSPIANGEGVLEVGQARAAVADDLLMHRDGIQQHLLGVAIPAELVQHRCALAQRGFFSGSAIGSGIL